MAAAKDYIFTYGTLRKGEHNTMQEFLSSSARWIGKALFKGNLYYADGHPAAVSCSEQKEKILGDIYEFDADSKLLQTLDHYEGYHPEKLDESLYIRKKRNVMLKESGKVWEAWIYLYNQPVDNAEIITSGDYVQFRNR